MSEKRINEIIKSFLIYQKKNKRFFDVDTIGLFTDLLRWASDYGYFCEAQPDAPVHPFRTLEDLMNLQEWAKEITKPDAPVSQPADDNARFEELFRLFNEHGKRLTWLESRADVSQKDKNDLIAEYGQRLDVLEKKLNDLNSYLDDLRAYDGMRLDALEKKTSRIPETPRSLNIYNQVDALEKELKDLKVWLCKELLHI